MKENIYKKGKLWHYDLTSNGETISVTGKTEDEVLMKMDELAFGDVPKIDFAQFFADSMVVVCLIILIMFLVFINIILLLQVI